ncbi:MAG: transcriptional regulator NrdR [Candidatus Obscuribacterales bacterium]|nr:transcriptional regulator NrdR [Candidatus Obscuribacterales bacterium]
MFCPFCQQNDSRVLESRLSEENTSIRRRRECESCKKRFTTYERIESIQILVVKNSGSREPYSREKLMTGIVTACRKTTVSAAQIEELIDALELELQVLGKREIQSSQLGELTLARLRLLNQVAYVRFASVYRQFQSVEDFISELQELAGERFSANDLLQTP